jgi:starch phosphorylase
MAGTQFSFEVRPRLPERLARLEELANDLLYSWDRQVRGLFYRLDTELWEACGHNPKVFLRRVAQSRLEEALEDRVFMEDFNRVLSSYDTYHEEGMRSGLEDYLDPEQDLIAYFCAEFGLHESFPIYSGGLGILAGDHCKAASDLGAPFIAVGLLYRQGYFTQTIDNHGHQIAHYTPTDFRDLPVSPAKDAQGNPLTISVEIADRTVQVKVWEAKAGHIKLYLLDTDLPGNSEHDRSITYQLYGGDTHMRIQQEMVLGIGGVRALRALNLNPSVWHINEGHSAFQIIERCFEQVGAGLSFDAALEVVAAGTVFTTHTPVAAGHDIFEQSLLEEYFSQYLNGRIKDGMKTFLQLGETPDNGGGFNMTALALRGSRFHNGVSRIHGNVASHMESYVWPQIPPEENPLRYVTNGVHVPTFLAREWVNLFDMRFRDWRNELLDEEYWDCIDEIPDHRYWSLHQSLKSEMLENVHSRLTHQLHRNGASEALMRRITSQLGSAETDVLVFGFARRFATYKRATLLFSDPERLARLLNDPDRPVVMIFAGKAHPKDMPGQHLIQVIHEFSQRPEFLGKILLLEGYDMALARKLVTGVDVWINTPEYPLEASGTSGEKAGINGVINLSVMDGWWGEGYNGENGWAIVPHSTHFDAEYRNREEASDLMDIIEQQVIPTFYKRDSHGYSPDWVKLSKASMKSIVPRFNAQRMFMDYVRDFYYHARNQYNVLKENNGETARQLAEWKQKIRKAWPGISLELASEPPDFIYSDEHMKMQVQVNLNGLSPEDVTVELLVGQNNEQQEFISSQRYEFSPVQQLNDQQFLFGLDMEPHEQGQLNYKIRMYPCHRSVSHPFETGFMVWL